MRFEDHEDYVKQEVKNETGETEESVVSLEGSASVEEVKTEKVQSLADLKEPLHKRPKLEYFVKQEVTKGKSKQ